MVRATRIIPFGPVLTNIAVTGPEEAVEVRFNQGWKLMSYIVIVKSWVNQRAGS